MLTRTLLSLVVTCSTLRIQQKEKTAVKCAQDTTLNSDGCECFLKGYRGGNIGSCSAQDQAIAATKLTKYATNCLKEFGPYTGWFYDASTNGNSFHHKRSALAACMRGSDSYASINANPPTADSGNDEKALISSRALVNPIGIVPNKIIDPLVDVMQSAQKSLAILAEKSDYPGTPPFGVCLAPATFSKHRVTLCDENSNTFDGFGMCCSDWPRTTATGATHYVYATTATSTTCLNTFDADETHCNGSDLLHYLPDYGCYCVRRQHRCYSGTWANNEHADSRCTGAGSSCNNGGKGWKLVKKVKVCNTR